MVNALLALVLLPSLATAFPLKDFIENLFKQRLTPSAYEKSITLKGLLTHSHSLAKFASSNGNTRAFGTRGYNQSRDYVEKIAKEAGLDVYRQTLIYPATTIISNSFVVDGKNLSGYTTFQYSAATPAEGITAPLVLVPGLGCTPEEYASAAVAGKLALVKRGNCTFVEKALLAKQANVGGVIIYNDLVGGPVASRIDSNFEENPPALSLSLESAEPLVARLNGTNPESIVATLKIDVKNERRASDNVIATTRWGDKNNVVFVGAHLDSVPAGPGINDDGSGTATVAELAKQIAKFKPGKNAVRFAWWTAEEVGLIGSQYYIDNLPQSGRDKIAAYINLDMTASPNYNNSGANTGVDVPPGTAAFERLFQEHYDRKRINHTAYAFTSGSDYRPFLDAGIPSGGVATGAGGIKTAFEAELFGGQVGVAYDPCYHQFCDGIDNLAHDAYIWNARAVADVIGQLTNDVTVLKKEVAPAALTGARLAGKEYVSDPGHQCNDHDEL